MFIKTRTSVYEINEVFPNKYKVKKYDFLPGKNLRVKLAGYYEGNKILLRETEEIALFQKDKLVLETGDILGSYFFKPSFLKKTNKE